MENVNQLVIDCVAKVLRINQTTSAEIFFEIQHCSGIQCFGWKYGYSAAVKELGEHPDPDFHPLTAIPRESLSAAIYLYYGDEETEKKLINLLNSLNTLEKELICGSTKDENMEANNENHE